jgi:hypothetical protein
VVWVELATKQRKKLGLKCIVVTNEQIVNLKI